MKYEELKAKIYSKFCGTGRQKEIDELFDQYEKENQASENPLDKYEPQYSPFELVENLRKDMQKEIENIKGINGLNFESHSNRLNIIEKKLESEQKQERFYYQKITGSSCNIFDRYGIINLKYFYDCEEAEEICKALNAMDGGK